MKVLRVLLIHNILWSHYKAIVFSELAKQCSAANVDLYVLQTALYGSGQKKLSDVDWSIHNYPFKLLFETSFEATNVLGRFGAYRREIEKFNPDVVVLPGYADKAVWLLTGWLMLRKIRLVQVADSTYVDHERVWWKELIKRLLLRPAEFVFCYGSSHKSYLQQLGVPDAKIRIRVQATNNQLFRSAYSELPARVTGQHKDANFTILFVGRLSPEKNLALLIKGLKMLPTQMRLTIVGAGTELASLQALAEEKEVLNRVDFINAVPWDKLVEYYHQADVFVLPSFSETWGLVINEAMLCHLPIVVSDHCGAAADLVKEGINGFTFSPFQVEELVEAIKKVYALQLQGREMGVASSKIISHYTPERSASQMLSGLQELFAN